MIVIIRFTNRGDDMNYQHYETFLILAETKNFSITAKKLFVAQSTVSNRIKEIESETDKRMFNRTNKTVELTPAGELFQVYAKKMVEIERNLKQELSYLKYKGRIRIGTPHAVYIGHIKEALKTFMNENKDISIKITISHSNQLIEALADDLIDLAVVSYLPKSSQIVELMSFSDQVIFVVKNDDKFLDRVSWCDFEQLNFIYSDIGNEFEKWLKKKMPTSLSYQFYIDQINEVVAYIEDGMGYSFVPESLVAGLLDNKSLKRVNIEDQHTYAMIHHVVTKRTKEDNPLIKQICSCFKKEEI